MYFCTIICKVLYSCYKPLCLWSQVISKQIAEEQYYVIVLN